MQRCRNAEVPDCGGAGTQRFRMQRCRNEEVPQCRGAVMDAGMQRCRKADLPSVEVPGQGLRNAVAKLTEFSFELPRRRCEAPEQHQPPRGVSSQEICIGGCGITHVRQLSGMHCLHRSDAECGSCRHGADCLARWTALPSSWCF